MMFYGSRMRKEVSMLRRLFNNLKLRADLHLLVRHFKIGPNCGTLVYKTI